MMKRSQTVMAVLFVFSSKVVFAEFKMVADVNSKTRLSCSASWFILSVELLWGNIPHSLEEGTKEEQRSLIQFLGPGGTNVRENDSLVWT
jgi:hypothetical protein